MLTIRRDQLRVLGDDRARRERRRLAGRFAAQGVAADYDESTQQLSLEDAAGGTARIAFGDSTVTVTTGEGRRFDFDFDERRRLQTLTDPGGFRVLFDHDPKDCLIAIRRGEHSAYRFDLDDEDNVVAVHAPDGATTRFTRDVAGRVVAVTSPSGASAEFDYGNASAPQRVVDPAGQATSYDYGDGGELEEIIRADGTTTVHRLDPATTDVAVEHGGRLLATITMDGDVQHVAFEDGSWTRTTLEEGRIREAATEQSTLKLEYDDRGHVISEETDGVAVRFHRNAIGVVTGIETPDGRLIAFERDREHRVQAVRDWTGGRYEVSYAPSGAVSDIRYPNGVVVERGCTPIGLPVRLRVLSPFYGGASVLDVAWTLDACDRVLSEASDGRRREFRYDVDGRLVETLTDGRASESFEVDAVGNRLRDGDNPCRFNALHQLIGRGRETYTYDVHGRMVEGGSPTGAIQCVYDARGQLVETRGRNGTTRYAYDPLGRRIRKEHGDRVSRYIWAGVQLLAEISEQNGRTTRRDYVILPELATALAVHIDGEAYCLHHGRRQEPLVATDHAGRVVWKASYSAFGHAAITVAEIEQPLRLIGQYFDSETGLHYNVRRYYDPELGRFLTPDPLGHDGGSFNLYAYGDGDPLNRTDPTGEFVLLAVAVGAGIGAVIGAGAEAWRQRDDPHFDAGKILKEAGKGAVVGAIGTGVGLLLGAGLGAIAAGAAAAGASALALAAIAVVGGALVGGVTAAIEQCVDNKLHDRAATDDMKRAIVTGAVIGALTAGLGAIWANRVRRAREAARAAARARRMPPSVRDKILHGERIPNAKSPGGLSSEIRGGHSPSIKKNPDYAVQEVARNADGTSVVKFKKKMPDGKMSKTKKSTLAPESWDDDQIVSATQTVAETKPVATRPRDGATLHRETIDGVQWEVIKDADGVVTSSYPTGGTPTGTFE